MSIIFNTDILNYFSSASLSLCYVDNMGAANGKIENGRLIHSFDVESHDSAWNTSKNVKQLVSLLVTGQGDVSLLSGEDNQVDAVYNFVPYHWNNDGVVKITPPIGHVQYKIQEILEHNSTSKALTINISKEFKTQQFRLNINEQKVSISLSNESDYLKFRYCLLFPFCFCVEECFQSHRQLINDNICTLLEIHFKHFIDTAVEATLDTKDTIETIKI